MKKKNNPLPTFQKINSQSTLTRSQWVAQKIAERPKFSKTETLEEFKARGGAVKECEPCVNLFKSDSRFTFKEKRMAARQNVSILRKLTSGRGDIGFNRARLVEANLEKRVKRKRNPSTVEGENKGEEMANEYNGASLNGVRRSTGTTFEGFLKRPAGRRKKPTNAVQIDFTHNPELSVWVYDMSVKYDVSKSEIIRAILEAEMKRS